MASRKISYNDQNYTISYEILNQTHAKCLLFLHGWGSNKEIMKQAFGTHLNAYKHIYIDLPGFGRSSIACPLTTKDYAAIVSLFLDSLHVRPAAIIGHSFGGKVATLLEPQNLVLLSSAGIVVPKSLCVKTKIIIFKIFKNSVPKSMYKFFASADVSGLSQVMYETLKNVVNEDFIPIFKNTTSNTLIFWGKEDKATPLQSGEKISEIISKSKFFPLEGDHFFFMKNAKIISQKIEGSINARVNDRNL